jgi:hypothetical protein
MASLLAAAIFFVGIHFVISGSALRGKIVASIDEGHPDQTPGRLGSSSYLSWRRSHAILKGNPSSSRPFGARSMK